MRVTVKDVQRNLTFEVEVEPSTTVDVLKLKISAAQNLSYNSLELRYNGLRLTNNAATLQSLAIADKALIELDRIQTASTKQIALAQEAKRFIEETIKNPQAIERLCETDPEMAEAVLAEDANTVAKLMATRQPTGGQTRPQSRFVGNQPLQGQQPGFTGFNQNAMPQQGTVNNSFNSSFANYDGLMFNAEHQKRIEDQIQLERWNQLQAETYENYPELFIPTEMLFIKGKVNSIETEIFIDTGAQTTVISKEFADRAKILKNVDPRFKTLIMGVGNQVSLGRIWQIYVEIQSRFFVFSAVVLENFSHDILLGLDMMKRHRCVIDLATHKLKFGLEGVEIGFLKDHEVAAIKEQGMKEKLEKVQSALNIDIPTATRLLQENHMNERKAIEEYLSKNKK